MLAKKFIDEAEKSWLSILNEIRKPVNEGTYKKLIELQDHLIDKVGENENHKLTSLLDYLGFLIEEYERNNVTMEEASSIDVIKYLMEEHNLKQSDLPEIRSQGVVSEILSGKRELNKNQITKLSKRFNVSPEVFLN